MSKRSYHWGWGGSLYQFPLGFMRGIYDVDSGMAFQLLFLTSAWH
jgi:hypothetical protein